MRLRRIPSQLRFVILLYSMIGLNLLPISSWGREARTLEREDSALPGASYMLDCFRRNVASRNPDVTITKGTQIFIFDVITAIDNVDTLEKLSTPEQKEDFCLTKLVNPYLELYAQAEGERSKRNAGKLAPLGGLWIETESAFIGYVHNLTGRETWGHSDITRDAISLLRAGNNGPFLSRTATHFLQHASQLPDLYHWKGDTYHAHTPESDQSEYKNLSRNQRIEVGQKLFKDHIRNQFRDYLLYLDQGAADKALLALGTICHGVQDLIYHRGMTLSQHAGLAYAGGFKNPDYPQGDQKIRVESEARNATRDILSLARRLANENRWKQLLEGTLVNGTTEDQMTAAFWEYMTTSGETQDIGYASLIEYYRKAKPYKRGGAKRWELEPGAAGQGLIVWEPDEILNQITNQVCTDQEILSYVSSQESACDQVLRRATSN